MRALRNLPLKEKDRLAIEAAAKVLRGRFPVEQVILFGSKARGEDQPESDIDLLVLVRGRVTHELKRAMTHALFPLQLQHEVVLSLTVLAAEQWESGVYQVLPIRGEIERDGVPA